MPEPTTLEEALTEIQRLKTQRRQERAKIVDTAQEYARQNNLCEVVDRALEEAGLLSGDDIVTKDIDITVPLKIRMDVNESFADMTEEEQKEVLSGAKITSVTWDQQAGAAVLGVAYGSRRVTPPQVLEFGDIVVTAVSNVDQNRNALSSAPPGYVAMYLGPDGRVKHYILERQSGPYDQATALCSNAWGMPRAHTARGEDRICARCTQRAHNL